MRAWGIYVAASAALALCAGSLSALWLTAPARQGVWVGLALAWLVQIVSFAVFLLVSRRSAGLVIAGWTAGTALRLVALTVVAWLVITGRWGVPAASTLMALAGGLFGLLLLEPVVFRARLAER